MKTCKTCEYFYKEHCCNGESDNCTEYVAEDDSCDKWEEPINNTNNIEAIEQSIECAQCGWISPDNCRLCRAERSK